MAAETEFYTVKELAKILGRSRDRVYEALRRGDIKGSRIGAHGAWLIPKGEVARLKGESPESEGLKQFGEQRRQGQQGISPIIVKAQEEHLEEIRGRIEEWRDHVDVEQAPVSFFEAFVKPSGEAPTPAEKWLWVVDHVDKDQSIDPLSDCLFEHLPFPELWENFDTWETDLNCCLAGCIDLQERIREEAYSWPNVRLLEEFEVPLLYLISLAPPSPFAMDMAWSNIEWEAENNVLSATLFHRQFCLILEAKNPLAYVELYRKLSLQFMQSKCVAELTQVYDELTSLATEIWDTLSEILIRRDYCKYQCGLCPNKLKQSR